MVRMAIGNTRAETNPGFSDYIENSGNCSITLSPCVCVRVWSIRSLHGLWEIKDSQIWVLLQFMHSVHTLSRLTVVQWRYLCEVVTHPGSVMVASVLSSWPEGSLCLQSTKTHWPDYVREDFLLWFRKGSSGPARFTLCFMCEGHLWSSGNVGICWLPD